MLDNLVQMQLKLLQNERFKKAAEATADLIGNKIADKIKRISKTSPQNNLETNEEEILTERYMSPEQRQKIIDDLRLI